MEHNNIAKSNRERLWVSGEEKPIIMGELSQAVLGWCCCIWNIQVLKKKKCIYLKDGDVWKLEHLLKHNKVAKQLKLQFYALFGSRL